MQESKKQNYLKGAAILAAASIIAKIFSAIFKLPIFNILGKEGSSYFQVTYDVYALILTISTAGIPVALSRLISAASASGREKLVRRYFSVGLPAFSVIGAVFAVLMVVFADNLAALMNNPPIAAGIRVLAPAVFFMCVISVYRGYAQGFENMVPTAVSQVIEAVSKTVFGIVIAGWLVGTGAETHIVSAGAILGVTIGLGLAIPLLIRYKHRRDKGLSLEGFSDPDLPLRSAVLKQILKVSVPITLGASFMSIMTLIDTSVVMGRLQDGLGLTLQRANEQYGVYSQGRAVYMVPTALVVPVTVSIIPAIAAVLVGGKGREAKGIMQSSVKLVNLLAMPAGAGIMVLSGPIYNALFAFAEGSDGRTEALVLGILGAASFFVCLQLMTTALLQANGLEKVTMLTFPIGGVIQVALDYFLVGNPNIGIIGSPVGTLTCYAVISVLNIAFIMVRVKDRPKFSGAFLKPLLCTAFMAVAAYSIYELLSRAGSGLLGSGRMATIVFLAAAIIVAVIVYAVLIIATRTITREDLKLIPKGDKLANILKIK